MKKILSVLSSISLLSTISTTTISCSNDESGYHTYKNQAYSSKNDFVGKKDTISVIFILGNDWILDNDFIIITSLYIVKDGNEESVNSNIFLYSDPIKKDDEKRIWTMIVSYNDKSSEEDLKPIDGTNYKLKFSLYGADGSWSSGLWGSFGDVEFLYKDLPTY
ncbi:hypothetical protein SLITO_v1c06050 [Spiroplasma litorale]|uniref:Lipoprotein n=1 Tax=Spiroplasma litorale TaxID=216942 RepID=A0A0K1W1P1_9MOLU|nr:hypothetical protein [Spiroplasma litorale]AKX34239.1 hypothetical protein SLITO_v1c06050 [Spiroplasma litorale]